MIEIGTLLQDRYLIEKQIGAGGMGAVYLAVDQRFDNHVAIKETFYMNDEFGEAFEREARLLNGLHHPVLPHVSDYFTENNIYFLVMQFIEGEDLSAILKREGAFPVKDVLRWTDSLLDALDYLHSQEPPVIHRDIKPQNLKLTPRGDIILLDFGLAKLKSEDTSNVKSVFGYSRRYSPLEQIQGTGTDARSDIFSLGATAYHLLTGKPPIDVLARAAEIVTGNPDPLKLASEINNKVPIAVASVLNSALALNADRRFVSAKAMRQALEFAVNLDSNQSVDELPEQISVDAQPKGEIVNSSEADNFPALEAFVAEAANNLPETGEKEKFEGEVIPVSSDRDLLPVPAETLKPRGEVIEIPINAAPRVNQSRLPLAALAALLLFVGLAAGYFIYTANSSGESNQTTKAQSITEPNKNIEQPEAVLDVPTPEVSESPELKNTEEARTKPVSIEKVTEKKESADVSTVEEVKNEAPKPAPVQAENTRTAAPPVKTPRRSESKSDSLSRPRTVDSESVPDIESIFTGNPSRGNNKSRQNRNPKQDDQISDEEWRQMRRERRRQRKQDQNRIYFPF